MVLRMLGAGPAQLVETANRRTGLSALEVLARSIDRETTLSESGQLAAVERLLRVIVNRLRFENDAKRHPQIDEQTLLPPLVICGLPRVGSTKLHQLLAHGGDFRSLLFWQGYNPAPFPDAAPESEDPRVEAAVRFLEWRTRTNPATNAAHFMAARNPEEDTYLLEYTLHTYWPVTYFEVPSFLEWLRAQPRDAAYQYLSRLLRYLQWQFDPADRRPWVLKSPPNFGFEAEMARHLPRARFVVLHREPARVVPSAAAIVRELRRLYCGAPADRAIIGTWAFEEYAQEMERHLAWRRTADAENILDIAYQDVRDDGIGVVRRVYELCGMRLTDAAEARMRAWSDANAQHKHGVHQYSLEEFGLTEARINDRFAAYRAGFQHLLGP